MFHATTTLPIADPWIWSRCLIWKQIEILNSGLREQIQLVPRWIKKIIFCRRSDTSATLNKYMLFAGWKVHIVKNCDRGLENAARGRRPRAAFSSPRSQFFTIWTDPKPVNNLFIFFPSLKRLCFYSRHTHASVTVTVVRSRKIRTALRTNQIAEFVTVTAWKKIKKIIFCRRSDTSSAVCFTQAQPCRLLIHEYEADISYVGK